MIRYILIGILCCTFSVTAFSQGSYKTLIKTANELYEKGSYDKAAEYYKSAWKAKPKDLEAIYKAGECYYKIRDYKNAARSFKNVKEENSKYEKVGYKYAMSLKQSGKYDEALREFQLFINNYSGDDFKDMDALVAKETEGCELAVEMVKIPDENMMVDYLESLNSDKPEFGPVAVDADMLYYSSMKDGSAKIYSATKGETGWTAGSVFNIAGVDKAHYGNGTLSADGSSFYFTQCETLGLTKSMCAIYEITKDGDSWSNPEMLSEMINEPGATATHPYISSMGGKEVLFFASDREGGFGGMDIWYCSRKEGAPFTIPINLGSMVNTEYDEITPYHNESKEMLYFSSNGHASLGGYDVFVAEGSKTKWSDASNLGMPINSGADDFAFRKKPFGNNGFLVSNRSVENLKMDSRDDDLFAFSTKEVEVAILGTVFEENGDNEEITLNDVNFSLYDVTGEERNLVSTETFEDGNYEFALQPNRNYQLEVEKSGYNLTYIEFETNDFEESMQIEQNIPMEKIDATKTAGTSKLETPVTPDPTGVGSSSGTGTGSGTVPGKRPTESSPAADRPGRVTASIGTGSVNYSDLTPEQQKAIVKLDGRAMLLDGNTFIPVVGGPGYSGSSSYTPTYSGTSSSSSGGYTSSPTYSDLPSSSYESGAVYKIQLVAVSSYKSRKYESVSSLGELEQESVPDDRGLIRILLGTYDREQAFGLLDEVKGKGFQRAFIVKYVDGVRTKIYKR